MKFSNVLEEWAYMQEGDEQAYRESDGYFKLIRGPFDWEHALKHNIAYMQTEKNLPMTDYRAYYEFSAEDVVELASYVGIIFREDDSGRVGVSPYTSQAELDADWQKCEAWAHVNTCDECDAEADEYGEHAD